MAAPGPDNSLYINLLRSVLCLAVSFVIWLVSGLGTTVGGGIILILLSGISNALNIYFWVLSSQMVSISLIEVFSMIGTVILPMAISPLLYNGDVATPIQWCGALALAIALAFFVNEERGDHKDHSAVAKVVSVALQVVGVAGIGITQKLYVYYYEANGLGSIELFNFGTFAVVFVCYALVFAVKLAFCAYKCKKNGERNTASWLAFPIGKVWWLILIAALALYGYQYFATAASTLPSAILYPVSYAFSMIVSLVLDTVFGKRMTWKRAVAFVFVAAAIALVNITV
jgi:drug/metabolite transporter (DMT)-like permease